MSDRVHHPLFARLCHRVAARAAEGEERAIRQELLEGLRGRVIEVGAGNGANFGLFPPEVSEVTAVEPERYLRARAAEAAERVPVPVRVVDGLAQELPFADDSFDAAVVCQVLCSVPSQPAALAEIERVLVPGGELRVYEHVIALEGSHARWQRLAARVSPLLCGGCHCDRDTGGAIEAAGFSFSRLRRFNYQSGPLDYVAAPRILGAALSPGRSSG